ncbi:MAG TPA: hypothetical protein VMG63_25495 [Terriglobia bacterium]|nr:hypothetical protein [Terriglobia bacterium]
MNLTRAIYVVILALSSARGLLRLQRIQLRPRKQRFTASRLGTVSRELQRD